jgi:hypothetical protein
MMADAGASTSRNLDDVLKKLQKNSYYNTKRQTKFDKQRSFGPFNSTDVNDSVACPIKETEKSKRDTSGELIDSYLGTIIGENDEIINNLADQLASSLNMPYVFMSIDEYNKLRESEMIQGPIKEENTEYILYDDRDSNGLTDDESGSMPNEISQDYVTVKGDMLIKVIQIFQNIHWHESWKPGHMSRFSILILILLIREDHADMICVSFCRVRQLFKNFKSKT